MGAPAVKARRWYRRGETWPSEAPTRCSSEASASRGHDASSKRPEREHAEFERLKPEGNAHQGQTQEHTRDEMAQKQLPTKKHEPKQVEDRFDDPRGSSCCHRVTPEW